MVDDPTQFDSMTPWAALQAAAEILGSQAALARICDVSSTAVWKWFQSTKRLPGEYALRVEEATSIPCYVLSPDMYPPSRFNPRSRFRGVDGRSIRVSFHNEPILKAVQA